MMEAEELAAVIAALRALEEQNDEPAPEPESAWKRAARLEAVDV